MNQQTQIYLDEWKPPQQEGRSGSFVCRDFGGKRMFFGCWPDKAAQAFPYVGSNQPVTVEYSSRTADTGKTYYDITKFLDGAPQATGPQPVGQFAPPPPAPAAPPRPPFPTGQPQNAAPQPSAQPSHAMLTQKDYSIVFQALAKAFASQLSLADPLETARQIHELICAHADGYRHYQNGQAYNPKGAPTMHDAPNPQAGTATGTAIGDEIPAWVTD